MSGVSETTRDLAGPEQLHCAEPQLMTKEIGKTIPALYATEYEQDLTTPSWHTRNSAAA